MQEKLKVLRKVHDVTQDELAKLLDINKKTYCNKENGISKFNCDEMFALSKYFRRTMEDIFLPTTYQNGKLKEKESSETKKLVYQTKNQKQI